MSHDLRHAIHDAASALEAIAREVGAPDEWVNPARCQRLANRLAGLAATLHEAATLDEQSSPWQPPETRISDNVSLVLARAPEWVPEPAPTTIPLSQADPPRPRCPVCDGWLVLVQVMPQVEDEPEGAMLYIVPPHAPGGIAYVWKCPHGPHPPQGGPL